MCACVYIHTCPPYVCRGFARALYALSSQMFPVTRALTQSPSLSALSCPSPGSRPLTAHRLLCSLLLFRSGTRRCRLPCMPSASAPLPLRSAPLRCSQTVSCRAWPRSLPRFCPALLGVLPAPFPMIRSTRTVVAMCC